jgi:hypothetical protein
MEDVASATAALLTQLSKLVKGLRVDEVQAILAGESKIMLVPKGSKVVTPLVLADVADQVRRSDDQHQVITLLDGDKRLTPAVLQQLADHLNISLPIAVKSKAARQLYIAQTMIEYRRRGHGGT